MVRKTLTLALASALLAGCGAAAASTLTANPAPTAKPAVTLTVFAAASLADAFTQLGQRFEALNPGVHVAFNFAGSQQLAAQINQGAPADVFASANLAQMKLVADGGRASEATVFALNQLVLVFPKDNPGQIMALPDLGRPGLRIMLAAQAVPVGQYALDFLDKASQDPAFGPAFKDAVLRNVVSYEDNAKQVFAKVALGEVDAGIVYATDALGASAEAVSTLAIPEAFNTIARYPIAALNDSAHRDWARSFVSFVLAPDGQRLLGQFGFMAAAAEQQ